MADVATYGLTELLWDPGWAINQSYGFTASFALAPTAVNPACWALKTSLSEIIVEEIIVQTDTAIAVTVGNYGGSASLTARSVQARNLGGSTPSLTFEAQVAASPGFTTQNFTWNLQANTITRFLQGSWLVVASGNFLGIQTALVAANVTVTIFGRAF